VLGGLTQESLTKAKNSVPGLSAIPVLGNLFSSRSYSSDKTQLFILIRPTVIMPRRQKGMGKLTRNAYEMMNQEMVTSEDIFGSLKDPVTHWFFGDANQDFVKEADKTMLSLITDLDEQSRHDNHAQTKLRSTNSNVIMSSVSAS
ncbi:hypothetical protein EBR77_01330, partial [bacterium]|nr:hypothetical protein [bacterium]